MKITGTSGDDTLPGTSGDDFIYGYGADTLYGDAGNDNLYGVDGNDTLYGGTGDDQLNGGRGIDTMYGGQGNDTYVVEDLGDIVSEASNEGIDTVKSYIFEYRLTDNVENMYLSGNFAQNGKGNELDNRIRGNDFTNQLTGYGGNDTLFGYGGNDVLNPGTGKDAVDGGTGTDILTYRAGATHGVDADLSVSDFGGPAHVVYTYGDGSTDTLIVRNVENLEGTDFNDVLAGNDGDNKILGRDGDDYLRGRAGNDDLNGGAGSDTFRFERAGPSNGVDIVHDYQSIDFLEFHTADGYDANAGFTAGKVAVGSGPQFVYDQGAKSLYYDHDGAGGDAAILIARILGLDALTQANIKIVNDGGQEIPAL